MEGFLELGLRTLFLSQTCVSWGEAGLIFLKFTIKKFFKMYQEIVALQCRVRFRCTVSGSAVCMHICPASGLVSSPGALVLQAGGRRGCVASVPRGLLSFCCGGQAAEMDKMLLCWGPQSRD